MSLKPEKGDGPRLGGCARAIGNPASGGGAPGQAALYIGALHMTLWHANQEMTTAKSNIP